MGVKEVFAGTLSESGLAVLTRNGVQAEYAVLAPHIVNRAGTGLCPMEETVLAIDDPAAAYVALREKAEKLRHMTTQ